MLDTTTNRSNRKQQDVVREKKRNDMQMNSGDLWIL
uniref:Uncharacterized protein n=1 Tax=Arundo donax TaxID=35708 RepID=A0A0A9BT54_ARUDO